MARAGVGLNVIAVLITTIAITIFSALKGG
jgi:hypothetical protein